METKYIAHIAKDKKTGQKREQSLLDHSKGVAKRCSAFAGEFGAGELGEVTGLFHDLGKYSKQWQEYIRLVSDENNNMKAKKVDHSTAGAKELMNKRLLDGAFCVAGHHTGLPDGGNKRNDTCDDSTLLGRMEKQLLDYTNWQSEIKEFPQAVSLRTNDYMQFAFHIRMLYSCLVDADYLDTEDFMAEGKPRRNTGDSIDILWDKLHSHLKNKGFFEPKSPINVQRTSILNTCIEKAKQESGLYSLTVPTGGGKTIASLAFALNHARIKGKKRVVYVIPYCSIIDQTAKQFREILGEENVLEHHSGITYDTDEENVDYSAPQTKKKLATENWDMPVVVTTAVQFFESLYANRSSKCRKLHNLANSVIIFDEAQMIPLPCLKPCVSAIGQLAKHYNTTAVLCTATQPALDDLFTELAPGLQRQEIIDNPEGLYNRFKRVTYKRLINKLSDEDLAAQLQKEKQVLCIVNTRKGAQEVFNFLQGEGNFHLSTLMHPIHRQTVLEEVRKRLKEGLPCRLVSTSLIEAGVDVDFPAVYREQGGLDSVLQAAGRCNRENKRNRTDSVVTVFQSEHKVPEVFSRNISAMGEATQGADEMDNLATIARYFKSLISLSGTENLDKFEVLKAFESGVEGSALPFKTIAQKFRLIDSDTCTIYIPVENDKENQVLIAQLQNGEYSKNLFRNLGRYGVSVYKNHFKDLLQAGDITSVAEDTAVLENTALYSEKTGLSLKAEEAKGYFI